MGGEKMIARGNRNVLRWAVGILVLIVTTAPAVVQAQVPPLVEAELVKMGRVVDPGCTGKLYRTLFDKNDYNTYWPVDAAMPNTKVKLYPGVTVFRDISYGPEPKDLIDIFVPDKGSANANHTVLIFIPGGAGNKIEQQAVESNMFYDNIGTWAANNGMIGVTMQRGGTAAGKNVALVIEWLQANASKYKGNAADMFLMAHSAGTGPLTQYIGRPDLYGQGVKGAIFMGAHPMIGVGGNNRGLGGGPGGGAGGGGGRGGGAATPSTATCLANANVQAGPIRGPSSSLANQGADAAAQRMALAGSSPWRWDGKQWISTGATAPAPAAGAAGAGGGGARGGAGGAGGGGRGGAGGGNPQAGGGLGAIPAAPAFTVSDGFKSTRAAIALAWGELDIDATAGAGMPTQSVAIHDELCKLEGPKAKDGVGHCPTMMWFKGESHMSEVFSFGSIDKIVSDQVLAFIKTHH
jgi:hypothetical protein